MMKTFWSFIGRKPNRERLGWLGGGLVVLVGALWAAYVHFFPADKPAASSVSATHGSVSIGGNVSGTTINAGSSDDADHTTSK